jgi:hypothetical protein
MKIWAQRCLIFTFLVLPANLQCQLICLLNGNCSCENEKVSPNLTITTPVTLTGVIYDASGATILFDKTLIQIRNPKSNQVLFSAALDEKGRFNLGNVPAGSFRLVALWAQEKKLRRLPLFDQPKQAVCSSRSECHLEIILALHGTDLPYEFCPPK